MNNNTIGSDTQKLFFFGFYQYGEPNVIATCWPSANLRKMFLCLTIIYY